MALNGQYVKIETILDGIFRDYGFEGHQVDWIDAMEWIGEAMDLVAAPKQYFDKVTDGNGDINDPCPIVIDNYRGQLPCDIAYIVQARENKTKIPMRYSTDTFHRGLEKFEEELPEADLSWYGKITFDSPLVAKAKLIKDVCDTDLTYSLSDCYIFTNFEDGEVEMAYKAIPMDTDGRPLVPDNVSYIKAVKAYVAEKIGQKMFLQGKLTGDKFAHLQSECAWYIGKATTAGLMPSIDEMESWKNTFVRLIPNLNFHDNAFKYQGDAAGQINHNSV